MRSLITRLAAGIVLIVLPTTIWAECAGWQTSAEARMACCAHGDQCPMHSGDDTSTVTQSKADACCARSEGAPSTPSSTSSIVPVTFAVVSTPVTLVVPKLASLERDRHALVPVDTSPIPRHLLLSVFLL